MSDGVLAWHYTTEDRRCRYDDGREDKGVGTTLTVDCDPELRAAARDAAWVARAGLNDLAEDIIPAILGWDMEEIEGGAP